MSQSKARVHPAVKKRGADPHVPTKQKPQVLANEMERKLEQGLEESMAGSDPPSITQPRSNKTLLVFVATLLGNLIAFRNRVAGAIIAAVLFAVGFIAWNYYPHNFGLPILKTTGLDGVPPNP